MWRKNKNEAGETLKGYRKGKHKTKIILFPRPVEVGEGRRLDKSKSMSKMTPIKRGKGDKAIKQLNASSDEETGDGTSDNDICSDSGPSDHDSGDDEAGAEENAESESEGEHDSCIEDEAEESEEEEPGSDDDTEPWGAPKLKKAKKAGKATSTAAASSTPKPKKGKKHATSASKRAEGAVSGSPSSFKGDDDEINDNMEKILKAPKYFKESCDMWDCWTAMDNLATAIFDRDQVSEQPMVYRHMTFDLSSCSGGRRGPPERQLEGSKGMRRTLVVRRFAGKSCRNGCRSRWIPTRTTQR